ncbi:MAG TPA: hypothetical protein VFP44_22590 [Usitatibacter sp.]|nr:hypothetical protein [Usitatibacter sp.]
MTDRTRGLDRTRRGFWLIALAVAGSLAAAGASALAALRVGPAGRYAIIAAWVAMYAAVFFAIDRHAPSPRPR